MRLIVWELPPNRVVASIGHDRALVAGYYKLPRHPPKPRHGLSLAAVHKRSRPGWSLGCAEVRPSIDGVA